MKEPTPALRDLLLAASEEARRDGSPTIEAQHLLLAFAADDRAPWAQALASARLDDVAIRDALDREFEFSLAAAGVTMNSCCLGMEEALLMSRKGWRTQGIHATGRALPGRIP